MQCAEARYNALPVIVYPIKHSFFENHVLISLICSVPIEPTLISSCQCWFNVDSMLIQCWFKVELNCPLGGYVIVFFKLSFYGSRGQGSKSYSICLLSYISVYWTHYTFQVLGSALLKYGSWMCHLLICLCSLYYEPVEATI